MGVLLKNVYSEPKRMPMKIRFDAIYDVVMRIPKGRVATYGQIARGGFPTTLYLGFNLARKFF